jgi:hypothetical protein
MFHPDLTLYTDASLQGWGAHMNDMEISGTWTVEESILHINCLELKAIVKAFQLWIPFLKGRQVLIATDNTTVVSYINKQGGTSSHSLLSLTQELLLLVHTHDITIRARHIPGRFNVIADRLSRREQALSTEWQLQPMILFRVFSVWGIPEIDLFATVYNAQLPVFVSPVPDPRAMAVDALSLSWEGRWMYMFPPFPILNVVIRKLHNTLNGEVILIAPWWPSQTWFPHLLRLCIAHPFALPTQKDLLFQPGNKFHNGDRFHLHAWRLSLNISKIQDFQRKLPRLPQPLADPPLTVSTMDDGISIPLGQRNMGLIRSIPLPLN